MEIHFKVIGTSLILLALIHIIFPYYFNWKEELASLSLINRQMMKIHTVFIAITVAMMGVLCFFMSDELINTSLGNFICLGLGIFWTIRFFIQLFGYSNKLWIGKKFETTVHILFSLFWLYMSCIFLYSYII